MMYYAVYESVLGDETLVAFFTSKKKAKNYVKQCKEFPINGRSYLIEEDKDMQRAENEEVKK